MIVQIWSILLLILALVYGDCFNSEYGLTGLGDDEDTCYVVLQKHKVLAGYVDKEADALLAKEDVIPCYEVGELFQKAKGPFACNCTGMICNGHALMEARHFIGLMVDKAPSDSDWK
ncbi:hypothetical protein PMAYCL1PPCAC_30571 [Pristionchus mayeri]|uniref:Uncharacterized protein n=1 Tax=Pristionchus mayeri TaxID=1317129 RepID=A0AAN5IF27_9BILA|nr:hypothetical protein PMAYCL1PPCAC_30571 [Pristionchus mayeri]